MDQVVRQVEEGLIIAALVIVPIGLWALSKVRFVFHVGRPRR